MMRDLGLVELSEPFARLLTQGMVLNHIYFRTPEHGRRQFLNPADVEACYRGGANGYITKSLDVEDMEVSIRKLVSFWLEVASLPQGEFHGRG